MTDWGVHLIDYALFGMNKYAPKSVMSMGGKFAYPDDACETPDTQQTIYDFGDFTWTWSDVNDQLLHRIARKRGNVYAV